MSTGKLSLLLLVLVLCPLAQAEEVKTVRATRGHLTVAVTASGAFEAKVVGSVVLAPLAWRGKYTLLEAVPPGSTVAAGDVVMRFADQGLQDSVSDARFELEVARLEQESLEERHELARAAAEKSYAKKALGLEKAERRLRGYLEHEKPQGEESRRLDEDSERQSLQNAEQELAQLLLMYGEDELVDETEKIVLARAKWNVERRKARNELSRRQRAFRLEYDEKEREKQLRRDLLDARADMQRARVEAAIAGRGREIEVMRARRKLDRRVRDLEWLSKDLAGMTVRAPAAGVLLHGPAEGGVGRRFTPGRDVNSAEAVASIVDPTQLVAVLRFPSEEVLRLRVGATVSVKPFAEGAGATPGVVEEVGRVPAGGTIEVRCRPEGPLASRLLGTGLKGMLEVEKLTDALLIPLSAVRRECEMTYLSVRREGVTTEVVEVILGPDDGKNVVVLDGLEEGDEVVLP